MKKIIIALLIVAIFGLATFFMLSSNKWKHYENSRYSFSVDYPAGWTLGEAPINNDGRDFAPSDGTINCHAYGFANALQNKKGEPQTLSQFVIWLTENLELEKVLAKNNTNMAGQMAEELISETEDGISQGVYILGTESGRGLVCYYSDMATKDSFQKTFKKIQSSFKISAPLDIEERQTLCSNYLNGILTPVELESFTDDKYTEVTLTSRNAWDKNRLPKKVTKFENLGYACTPMPLEFEGGESKGGVMAEPVVTKVQWDCELEYADFKYLQGDNRDEKSSLEAQGYICESMPCAVGDSLNSQSGLWLCTK